MTLGRFVVGGMFLLGAFYNYFMAVPKHPILSLILLGIGLIFWGAVELAGDMVDGFDVSGDID